MTSMTGTTEPAVCDQCLCVVVLWCWAPSCDDICSKCGADDWCCCVMQVECIPATSGGHDLFVHLYQIQIGKTKWNALDMNPLFQENLTSFVWGLERCRFCSTWGLEQLLYIKERTPWWKFTWSDLPWLRYKFFKASLHWGCGTDHQTCWWKSDSYANMMQNNDVY